MIIQVSLRNNATSLAPYPTSQSRLLARSSISRRRRRVGIDLGLRSYYTDRRDTRLPTRVTIARGRRSSSGSIGVSPVSRRGHRTARKHSGEAVSQGPGSARISPANRRTRWSRSHDLIAFEDLKIRNMVRNRHLAESIAMRVGATFCGG